MIVNEKLTSEFLNKCHILENTFSSLLLSNSIKVQFEDFLYGKLGVIRRMSEKEFIKFIINDDANGLSYGDFVK